MEQARRWNLWHLSALVVASALAFAMALELRSSEAFARFVMACGVIVLIAVPIIAGSKLSGWVAARRDELAPVGDGLLRFVLKILGCLASLVMGVGVVAIVAMVVAVVLMVFRSIYEWFHP